MKFRLLRHFSLAFQICYAQRVPGRFNSCHLHVLCRFPAIRNLVWRLPHCWLVGGALPTMQAISFPMMASVRWRQQSCENSAGNQHRWSRRGSRIACSTPLPRCSRLAVATALPPGLEDLVSATPEQAYAAAAAARGSGLGALGSGSTVLLQQATQLAMTALAYAAVAWPQRPRGWVRRDLVQVRGRVPKSWECSSQKKNWGSLRFMFGAPPPRFQWPCQPLKGNHALGPARAGRSGARRSRARGWACLRRPTSRRARP